MARLTKAAQAEYRERLKLLPGVGEKKEVEAPKLSLKEFVSKVYPKYQWYHHCNILADVLQRVAEGELKRVMIFMPPRHGKSQIATRLFPAYFLYRHPDKFVGINSYAAELAFTFSRAAREAFTDIGGEMSKSASAVKHWETTKGGGCWSAGVGGPITGKGFSLGVVDDPLKNQQEAQSATIREGQKEWYQSTFYTRGEGDAAIVIILTRWHEDDLAGWLLKQEKTTDEPENWHVVNFPAIAEENPPDFPPTCTVEPDWRQPGEPLCPERFSLKRLMKIAATLGKRIFSALFQQRPTSADGDIFKREHFKFYTVPPAQFDRIIFSADCTFKESSSSDFVVIQVWGKKGGEFWLIDQFRARTDINGTLSAMRSLTAKHPKASAKLVEAKANGQAVIDLLKRQISGLIPVEPEGGKQVRAVAAAPYFEAGNVYLPDPSIASWIHDYCEELANFPNGANDDCVDSTSQALVWLNGANGGAFHTSNASWSRSQLDFD